jgi:hypothetical protein
MEAVVKTDSDSSDQDAAAASLRRSNCTVANWSDAA